MMIRNRNVMEDEIMKFCVALTMTDDKSRRLGDSIYLSAALCRRSTIIFLVYDYVTKYVFHITESSFDSWVIGKRKRLPGKKHLPVQNTYRFITSDAFHTLINPVIKTHPLVTRATLVIPFLFIGLGFCQLRFQWEFSLGIIHARR